MSTLPRGVRNANPTNIDYNPSNDWVGQIGIEPPPLDGSKPRFARFDSPVNGIRAASILIQNYQKKYSLNTIRGIVSRWAPSNENNTADYIQRVAAMLKIDPDSPIDTKDYATMRALIVAKIAVECANYAYPPDVIDEGLRRSGLVSGKSKAPVKSATLATASTLATPAAGIATILTQPELKQAVEATGIPWLVVGFGLLGVCATVYLVIHSMRRKAVES